MRLLLDESLPKPFSRLLPDHDVVTVADAGWSGLTNGQLLDVLSSLRSGHCLVIE